MTKILWTTKNDLSAHLFEGWDVAFYENQEPMNPAELVYFRDPFNDENFQPVPEKIDTIINFYRNSKSIDNIRCFDDMKNIEDKYCQYKIFGEDMMPKTYLPSQIKFEVGKHLAKPRISQRAKNILFEIGNVELDDSWIIQEILPIKEEIRVYVVRGKIFETVSIKSSKQFGKVKVVGVRDISEEELVFVREAVRKIPMIDFVGFDVAILAKRFAFLALFDFLFSLNFGIFSFWYNSVPLGLMGKSYLKSYLKIETFLAFSSLIIKNI